MTKPTGALHWADSPTTLRTEPSEPTKNAGFSVLTKLPAQYFNYIAGVCGDWITWLNTRLFDEYTIPTMGSSCRLYSDPDTGTRCEDESSNLLPMMCLDPPDTGVFDDRMVVPVRYMQTALAGMVDRVGARRTSGIAITASTPVAVTWESASGTYDYNVGGMLAIPDTQIFVQHTGTYHISCHAYMGSTSGADLKLSITKGGTAGDELAATVVTCAAGKTLALAVSCSGLFTAADDIQIVVNSIGNDGAVVSARCDVTMVAGATPSWA